ncbi:MAG: penicillin acylase family protein [Chloroflexi bacterium]|nr:penicillin acylase family protein [Chloroflexota bacterium]
MRLQGAAQLSIVAGLLVALLPSLVASREALAGPACASDSPSPPAEILWDTWGVPHIFATTLPEVAYGYGWAQMHNHGNRLLRLYGLARGQAAEYWGEQYLASDRLMRQMGIPRAGRDGYAAQTPEFRRYLDAFAAGVNAYAREHPYSLDPELARVLPIDGADLIAHTHRVLFTFLAAGHQPPLVDFEGLPRTDRPGAGSNGWAIAPARSANGRSLLLANPHLPWDADLATHFEAQLVATADDLDVYGTTLAGMPVPVIAFNDYLGWTHTVNTLDGFDLYELILADGGYLFDGAVRPFETEEQVIRVRQSDGSLREEPLVVQRSVHGPVVAETPDGHLLAARVVGLIDQQHGALQQWWDMARARSLDEFEAALRRLQIPLFMVLYADREGHILSLFNGRVPVRPSGDFWFWTQPVPGDTAATLWTAVHSYEELPKVVDPPSGWVQNANSPPWYTTVPSPLDPDDYPPYLAPRFLSFREQRAIALLRSDTPFSLDALSAARHSNRLLLADRVLDDLLAAARASGRGLAREAADALAAWDRTADSDSRGGVVFALWAMSMFPGDVLTPNVFAIPWNPADPFATPDGLANPEQAVEQLERAASTLQGLAGTLDVPWGALNRLRREGTDIDLPGNGASGEPLGTVHVIHYGAILGGQVAYTPAPDGRFPSIAGETFVAEVEFGPARATARVLLAYGNATQPDSPHLGDQLALVARQEMRPAWRTRAELQGHVEATTPIPRLS